MAGRRSPPSLPEGLVLAIFGPTTSGKTAVARAVAERFPAELVSADSAALYRGLEILTAAPEPRTRLVRAALAGLELPPAPPPGARERWERLYDRLGGAEAHAALAQRDPAAAERVHPNNRRRVVRALELADAGSSLRPGEDRLWSGETRHPTLVVGSRFPQTSSPAASSDALARFSSVASSKRCGRRPHDRSPPRRARSWACVMWPSCRRRRPSRGRPIEHLTKLARGKPLDHTG